MSADEETYDLLNVDDMNNNVHALRNIFIPSDLKKDISTAAGNDLMLAKRLWVFITKHGTRRPL